MHNLVTSGVLIRTASQPMVLELKLLGMMRITLQLDVHFEVIDIEASE